MTDKAIIFDLDGTLMHTLPDIDTSMKLALTSLGYPPCTYENTLGGINHGARQLVAHALPENAAEAEIDKLLEVYNGQYAIHYADTTEAFDGVTELIDKLYSDGVKLAVLSNKPDLFTKQLTEKGFPKKFSPVIGQGQYAPKPSTEAPIAIAEMWNISPEKIIFVGDSDVDMKTAKAAGMYAVGVSWGYRSPDLLKLAGADIIVSTCDELYKLINGGQK